MNNETRELARLYRSATLEQRAACPDSTALARLVDGSAWPWQRRRVSAHLANCAHCADEYRTLLAARDGLREALDLAPRGETRPWRSGFAPAGVAVVAVAAISAALVLTAGPEQGPGAPVAGETIFASNFGTESDRAAAEGKNAESDTLFRSDFDGARNG